MIGLNTSLNRKALVVAISLASMGLGEHAMAQSSGLFVEEILVTARKQTESLQDVPISMTAINDQTIERLGVTTTADVIKLSPGLSFTRGIGSQDMRPDIRGVTALSGRSNIAILLDGVDMTTDALTGTGAGQLVALGLYDLERVEVVRGPQSALFGRNAFAGAINYTTKKPSSEQEGSISGDIGQYKKYEGKLSLSGPLIGDSVLYRLNLVHNQYGGQYEHPVTNEALDKSKTNAGSISLQFLPTENLEILTRADYSKQEISQSAVAGLANKDCVTTDVGPKSYSKGACDYVSYSSLVVTGFGPGGPILSKVFNPNPPMQPLGPQAPTYVGTVGKVSQSDINTSDDDFNGVKNELLMLNALVNYEMGNYTLTSNSAYTDAEGSDDYDLDHLPTTYDLGETASNSFSWVDQDNQFNYHNDVEFERTVYFQDFHLSFDAGNNIRWLLGAEYYYENYDNKNFSRANSRVEHDTRTLLVDEPLFPFPGSPTAPVTYTAYIPYSEERETTSWGVYGSFDWNFAESWEASLSARYQQEEYDVRYNPVTATKVTPQYDCDPAAPACVTRIRDNDDFNSFNPRLVISNFVTDTAMLYASVAQGTKPGGYTFQSILTEENRKYDQEKLISYELGWKTSWINDRLIVNGALFYMDNTDKQANTVQYEPIDGPPGYQVATPVTYVDNIGESDVYGLELQVSAVISEGLTANLSYAYVQTNIDKYTSYNAQGVAYDPFSPIANPIDPDAVPASDYWDNDLSGNELPQTPENQLLLTFNYDWIISNDLDGFARWDTKYTDTRYVDLENTLELDDVTTMDFQIGIRSESLEVLAYITNFTDEDTTTNAVSFVNFTQNFERLVVAYPTTKREGGVRLKWNF